MHSLPSFAVIPFLYKYGTKLSEVTLQHSNMIELMNSDQKFDVIVIESFFIDSLIGLGHFYKAPVAVVTSSGATIWTNDLIGNPSSPSYMPNTFLSYTDKMTFLQRFYNGLLHLYDMITMELIYKPGQRRVYKNNFPDPKPRFDDIYSNGVSLVFVNSHFSLAYPRPTLPNMVEIGGIQITKSNTSLPKVSYLYMLHCFIVKYF